VISTRSTGRRFETRDGSVASMAKALASDEPGDKVPVLHEAVAQGVGVVLGAEPAGPAEAEERLVHVAAAQLFGGRRSRASCWRRFSVSSAWPHLRAGAANSPAGVDLRELLRVADEDELAARGGGVA
jgi:hypothetical protein